MVAREVPLIPVRVASVFVEKNDTSDSENEESSVLDRAREVRACLFYVLLCSPFEGCVGIGTPQPFRAVGVLFFTHGVRMGGRVVDKSLSGLYLKMCKVYEVDTL